MSSHEFNQSLELLTEPLSAFALSLTRNREDARDLYQETAFKIIHNREKFKPDTNFKAWTFTIMKNIFINNYRKKIRSNVILDASDNQFLLDSGKSISNNLANTNMFVEELNRMISSLDENFKIPFLMHHQGYKYNEIAEKFNLPLGTVKSRIFFARRTLQALIKQQYGNTYDFTT